MRGFMPKRHTSLLTKVLYTVSQRKVPNFKLSVTLSNLTDFQKFCTAGKRMKFATKHVRHYPPHLRYVATLPWEIKNSNFLQIFSGHVRKCKQIAYLSPLTLLFIHKFGYFRCLNSELLSILVAIKIFCVTVLLLVYFCYQFVPPEIRRSRRHCSVCQQSTWYSVIRTRFW